jgi:hypothetical protein
MVNSDSASLLTLLRFFLLSLLPPWLWEPPQLKMLAAVLLLAIPFFSQNYKKAG